MSSQSNKCTDLVKFSNQNTPLNLKSIKEAREKLISQFYVDMKQTADRIKTNVVNIPIKELKFVRPNRVETITMDNKNSKKKLNETKKENQMSKTIIIEDKNPSSSKIPRPKPYKMILANNTDLKLLRENKFYKQKIMSKALIQWKNIWWQEREEWRLNIKAQCYQNYIIYRTVWTQWRLFVNESRTQNRLEKIAIEFNINKSRKKCLLVWKGFLNQKGQQRNKLKSIQETKNEQILHEYFEKWQNKYTIYKKRYKMYEIATKHFNLITLSKVFLLWKIKYEQINDNKRNNKLADEHYREVLVGKCFNSLVYYKKYRQRKNKQKFKVDEYYDSQLIYRVFKVWSNKSELKNNEKQSDALIESFQRKYHLLRYFHNWKYSTELNQKLHLKEKQCIKLYEKKLKTKVFEVFKDLVGAKNLKQSNEYKADRFYSKWILRHFLNKWFNKHEEKEDIQLMHLTYKANKFHDNFIIKCFYSKWHEKLNKCIKFNTEYEKYDKYYEENLKQKVFDLMRLFVIQNKNKRENYLKAEQFFIKNTLYNVYSLWFEKSNNSIEDRMNERIAILHYEAKYKSNIFQIWFNKYEKSIDERYRDEEMNIYYEKRLKEKLLKQWRDNVMNKKREQNQEVVAVKHDFKRICIFILNKWRLKFNQCKEIDEKYKKADQYDKLKKCRFVFLAWKSYSQRFTKQKQEAQLKYNAKLVELKKYCFNEWKEHVKELTEMKFYERIADAFYAKSLLTKTFSSLRFYVSYRQEKIAEQEESIKNYRKIQSKLIVKSYFTRWSQKRETLIREKLIFNQSMLHLKQKLWVCWRKYVEKSKELKFLEKKADWFNNMRLKLQVFNYWSIEYRKIQDEQELNSKAICFWAWKLQQKVLICWLTYINQRKLKKKRYDDAISDRQNDILKTCIQQILFYSSDSKQRRQRQAVWYGKSKFINTKELALKYASIWREKVAKKHKITSLKQNSHIFTPLATFTDNQPTVNRPKPRKPSFLLDSITNEQALEPAKPVSPSPSHPSQTSQLPIEVIPTIQSQQTILLPPSAFTTIRPLSGASSMSSVLIPPLLLSTPMESKRQFSNQSSPQTDDELIQLKQRIEYLSLRKEKLKRLKEQECLLQNCISSSEVNNMSISETIFNEIKQVRIEINELTAFIKKEKIQVNALLKKYQL